KNKTELFKGVFLAVTFIGVLALIFSPVFGKDKDGKDMNGLVYADDMFNKLSKGSSYFIPKVSKSNEAIKGTQVSLTIKLEKAEQNANALKLLTTSGAAAQNTGAGIELKADLGAVMAKVLQDADDMYKNDGKKVADRYGMDEKEAMTSWWSVLKVIDKSLKKQGRIEEAKIVSDVMKKAVEPAYNYYGINAQQVSEKAGIMTGLLIFYVAYTMWWGFAIFYMFDGIGLTMKKAKVKKEV
ncbi:MAG: hypothetical protein A2X57_00560, partial [Nitrospirae bacterium GWD2_57_8]